MTPSKGNQKRSLEEQSDMGYLYFTWAALAHTVTGSNLEIADATLANTRWPCNALSRQLSGRSCDFK